MKTPINNILLMDEHIIRANAVYIDLKSLLSSPYLENHVNAFCYTLGATSSLLPHVSCSSTSKTFKEVTIYRSENLLITMSNKLLF